MTPVSGAWGSAELAELLTMFDNGVPLNVMALALNRKGSSVVAKLHQQGRLVWVQGDYVKPWASRGEIARVDDLVTKE